MLVWLIGPWLFGFITQGGAGGAADHDLRVRAHDHAHGGLYPLGMFIMDKPGIRFFALNGLVMAGGLALWPHFARMRHQGDLRRGPFLLSALFATA
ncbi:hypothetical protein CTI14_45325, partial [Methylobacterium radiotolerans]